MRVGVSSAFFARFGLDNPWDLDAAGVGWGDPAWSAGRRAGRPRGVLGSFWDLFERRLMGHLMGGVLFRGGLGLALHHPWADWLPFLDHAGDGWMWRDRSLGALARIPGSGLRRPRSPWGPFASPSYSYLLPELEEIEAEEPTARRRFRRRSRKERRALPATLPLAAAAPRPQAPVAGPVTRAATASSASPLAVAPRRAAAQPWSPAPTPEQRPSRAPAAQGMARVLARQQAPVGAPSLRRAVQLRADQPTSPFASLLSGPTVAPPALQSPMHWAETRLQQAEDVTRAGRPRPVAATASAAPQAGMPPAARRTLQAVLFRSPSLAFLAPVPEATEEQAPEREPSRRASTRRPARPRPSAASAKSVAASTAPRSCIDMMHISASSLSVRPTR